MIVQIITACEGETVTIFGIPQAFPGTYFQTLQSTDGCDSLIGIELTFVQPPLVTIGAFSEDTLCEQSNLVGLPPATPLGGAYSGPGVLSTQFDPGLAGTGVQYVLYTYTAPNSSCSASDSVALVIEDCLGIDELTAGSITVYPNPFIEFTTIAFPQELNGNYDLELYDPIGKRVYVKTALKGRTQIIRLQGATGLYLLVLVNRQTGERTTKRCIAQE
jgi:hypothetical protein